MMPEQHETTTTQTRAEPCRTCGKAVREIDSTFPFCSERCRMGDLGKWFSGEYTISRPIEERDLEEGVD